MSLNVRIGYAAETAGETQHMSAVKHLTGNWRAVCCEADRIWCQTRSASWETLTINMAAAAFLSCFSQQIWHGFSMISCVSVDIPQSSWQRLSLCWCWETDSRCRDDATCKQLMGFKTKVVLLCTDADPAGAQTHMNYLQLHDSSTVISINKLPTSFCTNIIASVAFRLAD